MSDEYDDDVQDDGGQKKGNGLRAQLESALAQLKSQSDELAKFRAEKRSGDVSKLLEARGVPARAAKFYTSEDVSDDAVDKWLKDNEGLFATSGQQAPPELDANAQAVQRVSAASYGSSDPATPVSVRGEVVGDHDQLIRDMKTLPREELQKRGMLPPDNYMFGRR